MSGTWVFALNARSASMAVLHPPLTGARIVATRNPGQRVIAAEPELRALMLAALEGDNNAYRALLSRLTGHLRAYYMRRAAEDAEDLVQETLLAIHTRRDTYDPSLPFTAWVHAIARHKMIDAWRRNRRGKQVALDDAGALFAVDETGPAIARRDVTKLLETLPDGSRRLVEELKLEEKSVADIAARTGMSESAIKVGVHRSLKALAARIAGRSET